MNKKNERGKICKVSLNIIGYKNVINEELYLRNEISGHGAGHHCEQCIWQARVACVVGQRN